MKFSLSQEYPVGLDVLWPVYGHPDYVRAKYLALGARRVTVEVAETTDAQIRVVLERVIAPDLDGVPDWARRLVGGEYVMRHESRCRRTAPGQSVVELLITPLGAPVTIRAEGSFNETAPGQTRLALDFEVTCSLPLVGGKVSALFAGQVREALLEDHAFPLGYLNR
ncbi:MAG: DUF2505 domain-containing protein, partial [Moraxellaceae bacterium]